MVYPARVVIISRSSARRIENLQRLFFTQFVEDPKNGIIRFREELLLRIKQGVRIVAKNRDIEVYDIVNSLESGVLIIDENSDFIFMNNKGYKILEIDSKEDLMDQLPGLLYQFRIKDFKSEARKNSRDKVT
ncbi:MAG: hypothetical protein GX046_02680, partial [Tissierellia bacterium]|nr:hypothetical protein [Tissierellia bacterium]